MDWNKFLCSIKRKWESNEEEFEENYRKRKWDEEAIEKKSLRKVKKKFKKVDTRLFYL